MKKVADIFLEEIAREEKAINLIASESPIPCLCLPYLGSNLHQKYAEGYPGKRYYNGCKVIDELENACIANICENFKTKFANVQPHSGSTANQAVFRAAQNYFSERYCDEISEIGIPTLSMDLKDGGHLSHFSKPSFENKGGNNTFFCHRSKYGLKDDGTFDIKAIDKWCKENKFGIIVVGCSSYPLDIPYKEIAEVLGKYQQRDYWIVFDVSHIAGLVVAELKENPMKIYFPNCRKVLTSTTHKTFGGIRHAVICWNGEDLSPYINHAVFPELQGGANFAIISALAVWSEWINEHKHIYKIIQNNILTNLQKLIEPLKDKLVFGKSTNHLALVRCKSKKHAQLVADTLEKSNIIVNVNSMYDNTWGIRIGSAYETLKLDGDIAWFQIGQYINYLIDNIEDPK